jgi:hypothetical protein
MKKTPAQQKAEFFRLLPQNGFIINNEALQADPPVYTRHWSKQVEVLWHGTCESTMEIRACIQWGDPCIKIFMDGRFKDSRSYTSPKRCINAIREIVSFAGFDFEEGQK